MHPPDADVVIVRHGEIGVKSEQVRRKMERRLAENLDAMLGDRDVDGERAALERRPSRARESVGDGVERGVDDGRR